MDDIKTQLIKYREKLLNFTGRNRELYYYPAKGKAIGLTEMHTYTNPDVNLKPELVPAPVRSGSGILQSLFEGEALNINDFLNYKNSLPGPLEKRLKKMRYEDISFQKEYGLSGAWLLGPFLVWHHKDRFRQFRPAITPLLKCPLELENKKHEWKITLEQLDYAWNPTLAVALKKYWNVELPDPAQFNSIPELVAAFNKALGERTITVRHQENEVFTLPERVKLYEKVVDEDTGETTKREVNPEETLTENELAFYRSVTKDQFLLIDVFYLDLINANSLPLYADYEKILEKFENHPILSALLGDASSEGSPLKQGISIDSLDGIYKEAANRFVVDVDGSQHRAVVAARHSDSIVLVGPPGTGKSQTITNLIASNLAEGKKILFVAEKRAALDVVYDRLNQTGVQTPCVLVHGGSVSYPEVYKGMVENTKQYFPKSKEWKPISDRLDRVKGKINEYRAALEEVHENSDLDSASIFAELARYHDVPHSEKLGERFQSKSFSIVKEIGTEIDRLRLHIEKVPEYSKNILQYLQVTLSQNDVKQAESVIETLKSLYPKIASLDSQLKEHVKNKCTLPKAMHIEILGLHKYIDQVRRANLKVLPDSNSVRTKYPSTPLFIGALDSVSTTLRKFKTDYDLMSEDASVESARNLLKYFKEQAHAFSVFTGTYWQKRKILKLFLGSSYKNEKPRRLEIIESYLKYCLAYKEFSELVQAVSASTVPKPKDLGSIELVASDLRNAILCYDYAVFTQSNLQWYVLPENELQIKELEQFVVKLIELREQLAKVTPEWNQNIQSLSPLFDPNSEIGELHNKDVVEAHSLLLSIENSMKHWEAMEKIRNKIKDIEHEFGLSSLDRLLSMELSHHIMEWSDIIKSSVTRAWHRQILSSHRVLKGFEREEFESLIKEFQNLVAEQKALAPQEVNSESLRQLESIFTQRPETAKSLKAIQREAEKQRRVKPLRQLFEEGHKGLLFASKPCWLMNPLAISQFLPNESELFDLVIFDEASQVKVEDALPCLFRAKKAIIVGDPNQMPPTNFFALASDDDDDDDSNTIELENSILDLAQLKFPSELLSWHYRSRDEALITFSNRAFYAGRLIAVPNPKVITQDPKAYSFTQVEGYYNNKTGNMIEAEAVARFVHKHLTSGDQRTIGVIAFGEVQRKAIEDALAKLRESDSQFEGLYNKEFERKIDGADVGFFVKNLENVQGDERDLIVLSVGYAPSSPEKKLRLHFGPLTIQGGERRLNVAITRAKKQMAVFASFDPSAIPSSDEAISTNRGNALLGKFLQYSKAVAVGRQDEAMTLLDSLGAPGIAGARKGINRFEADVKRELEKEGFSVDAQIGTCGFLIDLGVKHPSIPGNYLIGIECDGAQFHSSPYARERDKIRESLLVSRGWKIHRVWSQDWSKNRNSERTRLISAVKNAINEEKEQTFNILQFRR